MNMPSSPAREAQQQRDRQPAPTGSGTDAPANQGSPATPVMKQFAKTDAERGDPDAAPAGQDRGQR
jgi:hypothetical protein